MVERPSLHEAEHWRGGWLEAGIVLGAVEDPSADSRMIAGFENIWSQNGIDGFFMDRFDRSASRHTTIVPNQVLGGQSLYGWFEVPSVGWTTCTTLLVREQHSTQSNLDWLYIGLPVGCLSSIDQRVGAYPFGVLDECQLWLEPLTRRLAEVGASALRESQGQIVKVGFEVAGMVTNEELRGELPMERSRAYVLRSGSTTEYIGPTEWR